MIDFWDSRYSLKDFVYGKEPNDFLKEQSKLLNKSSNILCLADGDGRNSIYLAKLGHQVTSVDFSKVATEKTNHWAKKENLNLEVICADLNDFDFGVEKWDVIVSIFAHLASAVRKKINPKIEESLKINGLLILEAYTLKQLELKTGGPSDVDFLMGQEKLMSEFTRLKFNILIEKNRFISEGEFHQGESSVVQMVAQKLNF